MVIESSILNYVRVLERWLYFIFQLSQLSPSTGPTTFLGWTLVLGSSGLASSPVSTWLEQSRFYRVKCSRVFPVDAPSLELPGLPGSITYRVDSRFYFRNWERRSLKYPQGDSPIRPLPPYSPSLRTKGFTPHIASILNLG
ncbi:hypothetical protein L6452_09922 [Arctium lappa]|uniref:Uncharacterized protein n=1 Tax=Arctium lappa TaxID=4217 RepID=A0ACB9DLQ1_ARCLA|nr:hypothetical protein L6452_09922 [Arctium lappa]